LSAEGVTRLVDWIRENRTDLDAEAIQRALEFADRAHDGQRRKSGIPYADHPFEVSRILAENGMDAATVMAGALHDVVEDTAIPSKEIGTLFGQDVAASSARPRPTARCWCPWPATPG
jgi:GTP pyrophosphokinase